MSYRFLVREYLSKTGRLTLWIFKALQKKKREILNYSTHLKSLKS